MRIITLIILFTSLNVNTEEVNDPLEDLNRKTYEFNEKHILSKSKNCAFIKSSLKGKVFGIINGENTVLNSE